MLTLGEAKTVVCKPLNLLSTDARVIDYINQAQRVLLDRGNWWGTMARIAIVSTSGQVTWPRMVARVDALAICSQPLTPRNLWYEFLGEVGIRDGSCCDLNSTLEHFDRGTACIISDIVGTNKKLRVKWRSLAANNGKKILFKGKNQLSETVYSEYPAASGTYIEGEYVTCDGVTASIDTSNFFTTIDSILKDASTGFVDLYELDNDLGTERLIGTYEPSETNIEYRRSLIDPFCSAGTDACSTGCTCTSKTLTAIIKRAFIPAVSDSDSLLISSLEALKLACMSLKKREDNLLVEADGYMNGTINPVTKNRQGGAIGELQAQQRTMEGDTNISISFRPHGTADLWRYGIGRLR